MSARTPGKQKSIGGVFNRRPLAILSEDTDSWPMLGLKRMTAIGTALAIGAAVGRILWKWAG